MSPTWEIGCAGGLVAAVIMQETWPMMARFLLMNMLQINCNMRPKTLAMRQGILRWIRPEVLPSTLVKPSIASGNIAEKGTKILTNPKLKILKSKNPKSKILLPKHQEVRRKNRLQHLTSGIQQTSRIRINYLKGHL